MNNTNITTNNLSKPTPCTQLQAAIDKLCLLNGPFDTALKELEEKLYPVLRSEDLADKNVGDSATLSGLVPTASRVREITYSLEGYLNRIMDITSRIEA